MSLKLVELQVAIPKTVDAGKLADQQQQQNAVNQSQMAALAEKERLKKLETVNRFGESEKTKQKRQKDREHNSSAENKRSEDMPSASSGERHPFKGRRVDFSG
ncbi:hypothetical protein [Jeotgalibacillus haloalkalitolerans]|uniref:RNA polymerase subunit sigma n=1 Tax=Jeotgalibacillus haloalkalitolerans TaxID=3104292 RepID=A0ABU5KLC4_9BACL|nr:hypothetical protein [Jeotgalibacillus sp. HH7-29]MDZ5711746.1 hypothetical protein [Jeotgalibacillus sp. HH7-29]